MKKIVIIEDDPDITEIIKLALAGKHLVEASNDMQGLLPLLEEFRPDLIMIDYYIGHKKADEVMQEIQALATRKDIPFILFTGHQDIKYLAGKMGASAWLAKPFALAELYACIEKVLSAPNP
ncbi:response regulator [Flavitalea flava]